MQEFKCIEIGDRPIFQEFLAKDQPRTSELTFTNLFMWRHRYRPVWRQYDECLLVIMSPVEQEPFGLKPVGTECSMREGLDVILGHLRDLSAKPKLARVCKEFIDKFVEPETFEIIEDRDNFDYVYLTENLVQLPGNRYHRKKNHVNKFVKNVQFEYRSLDNDLLCQFLELQEDWCELKDCGQDTDLLEEDRAIYEALKNHSTLGFKGGAILIDGKVEAFALGELLNDETAVIHIEKADPEIPGLYAAINQLFCANEWGGVKYVNREQDLGIEGLRKAKQSYYPDHLVEKFTLFPK